MTRDLKLSILRAQNGDKESMSKLLDENVKLVWNIVRKFNNRNIELEDLFQIGCEGFVKGIYRFNFDFNTELSTYLVPIIMGEIKRYIRDDGIIKVSRSLKELNIKIIDIKNRYLKEKGEEIKINEIAKELDVSIEEVISAMEASQNIEYMEDKLGNSEDGNCIGETLSNEIDEEESNINNIMVKNMLGTLNGRDRQIIVLRYFNGKTQSEIAKMLGISQVQVSRIEKKILEDFKTLV